MNRREERTLKAVAIALALAGLAAGGWIVPQTGLAMRAMYPEYAPLFWPLLLYVWATMAPGFAGLWEFWRISGRIGRDESFSTHNARSLFRIRALALAMACMCAVGAIGMFAFRLGQPGLMLLALGCGAACAVVAALSGVLARLVGRAAQLKAENDLTI